MWAFLVVAVWLGLFVSNPVHRKEQRSCFSVVLHNISKDFPQAHVPGVFLPLCHTFVWFRIIFSLIFVSLRHLHIHTKEVVPGPVLEGEVVVQAVLSCESLWFGIFVAPIYSVISIAENAPY